MRRRVLARPAGTAGTVVFLTWLGACAVSQNARPPESASAPAVGRTPTSATVITAADLASMNRPLLDIMRQRIPGMQVSQTGGCPEIVLRGKSTLTTSSAPVIYVDGNQSSNTCILNELRTVDLDQVEIYPGGVAPRAGYRAHPYGVILIFVKRAE
jgi:outer membrane receptor for ferrienterochelin and colicin